MTTTKNTFEGGTVGATIDGTSSLVGGDAITVYNNGGGVAQFASTPAAMHGTRQMHMSGVSGTGNITAFLPTVNATKYAWRGYCYIPSSTTGEVRPVQLMDVNSAQALLVRRTGSILAVRANGSTDVWTSSSPATVFPLDTWVRIGLYTDVAAGAMTFATYNGDSTTPLWTQTMSSGWGFAAGGTSVLRTNFGFAGNSIGDIYFDDVAQNDTATGLLGPAPVSSPTISGSVTANRAEIGPYTATGGTSPYTYSINPTTGTTNIGAGHWLVTMSSTAGQSFTVTATDANGTTANATAVVPQIAAGGTLRYYNGTSVITL